MVRCMTPLLYQIAKNQRFEPNEITGPFRDSRFAVIQNFDRISLGTKKHGHTRQPPAGWRVFLFTFSCLKNGNLWLIEDLQKDI